MAQKMAKYEADKSRRAFCSLARSRDACTALKNDFRLGEGLMDSSRLPESSKPHADLPVFCTSAIEYGKLQGSIKSDGDPSCFNCVEDTGIPALRTWCHALAGPTREKATGRLFTSLETLARSVWHYVDIAGEHDDPEFAHLKAQWDKDPTDDGSGIEIRLTNEFKTVVDDVVEDLKIEFAESLQDACNEGADLACEEAQLICEEVLDHENVDPHTIKAILRHKGVFGHYRDLNEALAEPLLKAISRPWTGFFRRAFFESLKISIPLIIENLFQDVLDGAANCVHPLLIKLMKGCLRDASSTILIELRAARRHISEEQKALSRSIPEHIKEGLDECYKHVAELNLRGRGSIMKRKAAFMKDIDRRSETIFHGTAEMIMTEVYEILEDAATEIKSGLESLAGDIEANISTLWEDVQSDALEIKAREYARDCAEDVLQEVQSCHDKMDAYFPDLRDNSPSSFPV
ncbi:hypothetical protein DENSPDRAFT_443850 [Dentipellis sp. KUC8613]|nr:hypothetical protein DENSPDRAFT_443850 [Dentipellis sp. KUC8613]